MTETNLRIDNMHCGGCERTVSMTVSMLPGIEQVQASFKTRTARIRFDPQQVTLAAIQNALAEVGYDATPQGGEAVA